MYKALKQHRWGVILAGGEGVRLRPLTRLLSGDERPKQYCPLLAGRTLLTQTVRRVGRNIERDKTQFVVLSAHEPFYSDELRGFRSNQIIVQPSNRGTLPAILCSLMQIRQRDAKAVVGFFPSDHHYTEEDRLRAGIDLAFGAADHSSSVILLGAAAKHAAEDYGWIEAEPAISTYSRSGVLRVKRFWEKPSRQTAQDLFDRGCIWNTFVMVGRADAFLEMIQAAAPELYAKFECTDVFDGETLRFLYEDVAPADFSKSVLSSSVADRLGVFSLGDVGWTDLGDPRRGMRILAEADASAARPVKWAGLWNHHVMPEAS